MGLFGQQEAASTALNNALPALLPLGLVGVWRWSMFVFRVIGWMLYKPQPPTPYDKYQCSDVTIIVPTIDADEEAMCEAMRSWVLNEPKEILIVTVRPENVLALRKIADKSIAGPICRVLEVPFPANKRIQLVKGIREARTELVCFTDDDAIWNSNFLRWLMCPFNDDFMGGTGSNQIMRPNDLTKPPTGYERIADMRLSSRMLEAAASTFYDGSVSCLSGRTALYHKRIITDGFAQEFTGEMWLNKHKLISGDDKFMTRWVVKHGWKMHMQISPECTLATTFKADGKFFLQILRWTRNTWRSDFKSLVIERNIWYRFPVQAVLMVDRMISPFTLMSGPILFVISLALLRAFDSWTGVIQAICVYILWVLVSRTLRILPHFYRCPEDFTYLPIFIMYQYFFATLKIYAAFTLHITAWGTRDASAFVKVEVNDETESISTVAKAAKTRNQIALKSYRKGNVAFMRRVHSAAYQDTAHEEMELPTHMPSHMSQMKSQMQQQPSRYQGSAMNPSRYG